MSRLIDALFYSGLVLGWPVWRNKPREDWHGRWGNATPLPQPPPAGRLAIHAVSVGEVNATLPIIRRLTNDPRFHHTHVVLAATTDTGTARAEHLFDSKDADPALAERVSVVRYPLDASRAVRTWFDRIQPTAIALVELELWPNFLLEAARRRTPVAVINGRLSERSFRNYRLAKPLAKHLFTKPAVIAAQDETYARRFRALAAPDVRVLGSVKWDAALDAARDRQHETLKHAQQLAAQLNIPRDRPIIVLGSAAPTEPALLKDAIEPLEHATLIVAPRKPEWFDAAARDLGPAVVRRSSNTPAPTGTRCFLLDTIGELRAAYALADIAVIGRSFTNLFGSDPMEPAALAKPLIIGPRHADFTQSVNALHHAGALRIATPDELAVAFRELLRDHDARTTMAEAARRCVEQHAGAADATTDLLAELMHATPTQTP